MKKTLFFLLAVAMVGLLATSCGDDNSPTKKPEPKKEESLKKAEGKLKIGENEFHINFGAFTSNEPASTRAIKTRSGVKFITPIAFTTDGLEFGTKESPFKIKGEGRLFVMTVLSSTLNGLDEGTHPVSVIKTPGMAVQMKSVDDKILPEVSKIIFVNKGNINVKKNGNGYDISMDCSGMELNIPVLDLKSLDKFNLADFLNQFSAGKTDITGNFSGEMNHFMNVDWNKYLHIDKFKDFINKFKGKK